MTVSLYTATVPQFRQLLTQVGRLIDKAEAFCGERGIAPDEIVEARLHEDMLPFAYQVKSTAVHSIGAIRGVEAGLFTPDRTTPPADFAGLRRLIEETIVTLAALDPAAVDALAERDMRFEAGPRRLDFTGAGFLLSFSMPNFYFHATTAYGILRSRGVALGKMDYIGRPAVKG
ncbi:DUF1993 domain-containing protein [Sphingomonas profundi]|uniref:DUF1993 domain-containing protein n=1 Tax=Alterirhizorhabdus profundi TaxID=2681549 RepID=UPI0012E8BB6C|nr:DUF1993 domain-containing protein [Sphingomonas profundi]